MSKTRQIAVALIIVGSLTAGLLAGDAFEPGDGWISLFNGKDLTGWKTRGPNTSWKVVDGVMANKPEPGKHGANILTERKFGNFKLHIEFKVPDGGNSGVYLRGRKEVQVHDSFGVKTPKSHHCGGIYSKVAPKLNAVKRPGEWNAFDITIVGRKITVKLNGKTIIDAAVVNGVTGGAIDGNEDEPGPIYLQGDHSVISYRNIWIKPLPQKIR